MIEGIKNNTLEAVWIWFVDQISSYYETNERKAIARVIFEDYFNLGYSELELKKDRRFSESEIVMLYKAIKKLKLNMPVQYITGVSYFRDLKLKVSPDVLIPRPETEELVQWVADEIRKNSFDKNKKLKIWDIGTGSGAIAISLSKELNYAEVFASDISQAALKIAAENANKNLADVRFFHHDILNDPSPAFSFDIIVSNPPYVRESEKVLMQNNVLDYEPKTALFVPNEDPSLFYRAIASSALKILNSNGRIYFEINESMGEEICKLLEISGFENVMIRKDFHDKNRFVVAEKYF